MILSGWSCNAYSRSGLSTLEVSYEVTKIDSYDSLNGSDLSNSGALDSSENNTKTKK